MALSIKNPETERLARELANATGESITEAVTIAVQERLKRCHITARPASEVIREAQEAIAKLPVLDDRTAEEILGYDEHGLPT